MKLTKLEAVRASAALYVFLGHFLLAWFFTKDSRLALPFVFGQEAVMIFFVLSGFVIYFSTASKPSISFREYFVKRFLRIYPIFVFALLVSFVMASFSSLDRAWSGLSAFQLIGNLLMLQDFAWAKPGVWFSPFFGDAPLWSLSYEWWFYMAYFPIWRFVEPNRRVYLVGIGSLLGIVVYNLIPNQPSLFAAYFITWWAGVEIAREFLEHKTVTLRRQVPSLCFLTASFMLWGGVLLWQKFHGTKLVLGAFPILPLRHFGACFAVVLGVSYFPSILNKESNGVTRLLASFAGVSYSLYVLHFPIACMSRWLGWINNPGMEFTIYIVSAFITAYLAESVSSKTITLLWHRADVLKGTSRN